MPLRENGQLVSEILQSERTVDQKQDDLIKCISHSTPLDRTSLQTIVQSGMPKVVKHIRETHENQIDCDLLVHAVLKASEKDTVESLLLHLVIRDINSEEAWSVIFNSLKRTPIHVEILELCLDFLAPKIKLNERFKVPVETTRNILNQNVNIVKKWMKHFHGNTTMQSFTDYDFRMEHYSMRKQNARDHILVYAMEHSSLEILKVILSYFMPNIEPSILEYIWTHFEGDKLKEFLIHIDPNRRVTQEDLYFLVSQQDFRRAQLMRCENLQSLRHLINFNPCPRCPETSSVSMLLYILLHVHNKHPESNEKMAEVFKIFIELHKEKISLDTLRGDELFRYVIDHKDSTVFGYMLQAVGNKIDPNDQSLCSGVSLLTYICRSPSRQSSQALETFLLYYKHKVNLLNGHGTNTFLEFRSEVFFDHSDIRQNTFEIARKIDIIQQHLGSQLRSIDATSVFQHAIAWDDNEALERFLQLFAKRINPNSRDENESSPVIRLCEIWSLKTILQYEYIPVYEDFELPSNDRRFFQKHMKRGPRYRYNRNTCENFQKKLKLLNLFFGKYCHFSSMSEEEQTLNTQLGSDTSHDCIQESNKLSIDPNLVNKKGQTALSTLVPKHFDLARAFLEQMGEQIDASISANHQTLLKLLRVFVKEKDHEGLQFFATENMKPKFTDFILFETVKYEYSEEEFEMVLARFGDILNPDVQKEESGETALHMAAKLKKSNRKLLLMHNKFKARYDPNIQDHTGNTALMYAIENYPPNVIKDLLHHPKLDLSLKNIYQQDIFDLVKDSSTADGKIRKLIEVAYQTQCKEIKVNNSCEIEPLEKHVSQIHKIIEGLNVPHSSKDTLKSDLDFFVEAFHHVKHGRNLGNIGMSVLHRKKLQGKRVMLLEELQPTDGLLDHLLQDETLSQDQLDEITACKTRRKCAEKLLGILPFCGENAFNSFLDALRKTRKGYISDALEEYDPEHTSKEQNPVDKEIVPIGMACQQTFPFDTGVGGVKIPLEIGPNHRLTLAVALYNQPSQDICD